jgi:hypothetical protein
MLENDCLIINLKGSLEYWVFIRREIEEEFL